MTLYLTSRVRPVYVAGSRPSAMMPSIKMLIVVTTDEEGPCPPNSGDPECTVDLPGRSLAIAKDTVPADLASVKPGDTVRYRVTVTNTGNAAYLPATAVDSLSDALDAATGPNNITVTGPGSASFSAVTQEITWSGPLQPGVKHPGCGQPDDAVTTSGHVDGLPTQKGIEDGCTGRRRCRRRTIGAPAG